MPDTAFVDRLDRVHAAIAEARRRGGWSHRVEIVAVTKTHGPEAVRTAVAAGITAVGENRVQEALTKQGQCADLEVDWHLIGGLQRNKARHAAGRFALIQSVDRLELASEINRRVPEGATQAILVQVNCSGEPQKGGVEPAGLMALLDEMRNLSRLETRGLMTMAAFGAPETEVRATFAQLRELTEAGRREGHRLETLSMGMSDDFQLAVEEGATMVRLGSALFGSRE